MSSDSSKSTDCDTELEALKIGNPDLSNAVNLQLARAASLADRDAAYLIEIDIWTLFFQCTLGLSMGDAAILARSTVSIPPKGSKPSNL